MTFRGVFNFIIGFTCLGLIISMTSCPSGKYEREDGSCVDCPAGYWGKKCLNVCNDQTYGVGCRKSCWCSLTEYCDHRTGCKQLPAIATGNHQTSVNGSSEDTDSMTFAPMVIILLLVGCNLLLTIVILYRSIRKRDKEIRQTGNIDDGSSNKCDDPEGIGGNVAALSSNKSDNLDRSEGIQGEVITLGSDEYEPPIIPTEKPENNVYTGIRNA